MKKSVLLLLCTLILAFSGANAQSPQPVSSWKTYLFKEENLSITVPALPSVHDGKDESEKKRRIRVVSSSSDGVQYLIYAVENLEPKQTLKAFIEEQTTSKPKWDLKSERDVTLDGFAGKAFVYPDKKGMVQFFATEDRLFDIRAYGAPVDDAKITRFFSGLSLTKIQVSAGPGRAGDVADIYKGSEVDTKVQLKKKPEPTYTDKAKSKGVTGIVVLRCVFSSDGTVTNIQVLAGLPYGLTEKAVEAAKKIKFKPATKDGHAVSMWMQLEYNFNLY